MTANYPGYWIVEVDSPQLGRKEVSVAESDLLKGQTVYLDYHIGRWSGAKEIVGLRLSRG